MQYDVGVCLYREFSIFLDRYDHEPGDDHGETITGLSACSRLKLYASSSLDGTIRIWNETNTLVR